MRIHINDIRTTALRERDRVRNYINAQLGQNWAVAKYVVDDRVSVWGDPPLSLSATIVLPFYVDPDSFDGLPIERLIQ